MTKGFNIKQFQATLEKELPHSSGHQRTVWASIIIANNFDLKKLAKLLKGKREVAQRFAWLLSDVAIEDPNYLFRALPYLFKLSKEITAFDFTLSFASYWRYCGVPVKNEAEAIDLLFEWIGSPTVSVTPKSRALWVLVPLVQKYPQLKAELRACLEDQLDKNTPDFAKRAKKVLQDL